MAVVRWGEWVWAALAGALACSIQATPALAASQPRVASPASLSDVLADPPSADYVPVPEGLRGSAHFGSLDADTIASEGGNKAAILLEFSQQQFTRGYRKGWIQRGTQVVLVEQVEEFKRNAGAQDHLVVSKSADQTSRLFGGLFDTPGIAPAYGVRIISSSHFETDSVIFRKGNLLFGVGVGRQGEASTDMALSQARRQYDAAPGETIDQGRSDNANPVLSAFLPTLLLPAGALGVMLVALLVILPLTLRRRRPRPSDQLPVFSADRRYWWDGTAWRDTTVSPPPTSPRSPDGAYWFDGVAWRPVPAAHSSTPGGPGPASPPPGQQ